MTKREKLVRLLDRKGYTDKEDVSTKISIFEYGIVRNPDTNDVLFAMPTDRIELVEGWEEPEYMFDWATIDIKDVGEALEDAPNDFYDYIDMTRKKVLESLNNKWLTTWIQGLNQYRGVFSETLRWDMNIDDAIRVIKNR